MPHAPLHLLRVAGLALLAASPSPAGPGPSASTEPAPQDEPEAPAAGESAPTVEDVLAAARVLGLELTEAEAEPVARALVNTRVALASLRAPLDNGVPPALVFDPLVPGVELRVRPELPRASTDGSGEPQVLGPPRTVGPVERPGGPDGLAFLSIDELGHLLRSGQLTCVELTAFTLARLERLDPALEAVVTLLPERALRTAQARDEELARGVDRGPLHGIPYGAKDLFAARGGPTTWGAEPFRDQVLDRDAHVVERLEEAGAVLVAKLSLGALAMGDVWYGGRTRNPWDPRYGSSGSSAGSASVVAAGSLPFALGTETLGSIVSPCVRCSANGLRPTFGRVSRDGAMALSWSMDKVGPITRSVRDAGLVLRVLAGEDPADPSTRPAAERPLSDPARMGPLRVRVGVPRGAFDGNDELRPVLDELRAQGHEVVEVELPDAPLDGLLLTLFAEAAAAFDELTRSGLDDRLTRQGPGAWPNVFRHSRFVPAVEYVNAQRRRTLLCRALDGVMGEVDLLVHAPYAGGLLGATNLTGHPTLVVPCGTRRNGQPASVCFTGRLYDEGTLLAVAGRWQEATEHHLPRPDVAALEAAAREAAEAAAEATGGDDAEGDGEDGR